jgi:glycosyltransferase involved in cell wall biosynthesis
MKEVYLEGRAGGWELHSLYNELALFPPEGYKFVVTADGHVSEQQRVIYKLNKGFVSSSVVKTLYDIVRPLAYHFYSRFGDGIRPKNVDLTYASQHVVLRKEPWIVDLEHVGALVAYGKIHVCKKIIEKSLKSTYCKKIMPWTEMGKKSLLSSIDCQAFRDKVEVVNLAVHPKSLHKEFDSDKIKLLFVGTANRANIGHSFAIKGGNEVLKAFGDLRRKYRNLELVVRSYLPTNIKQRYVGSKNLRMIDSVVPWQVLDHEFRTADIFLFPAHSTPGMAILDAMSYELPIVTTDVWANRELVDHGKTGFLIRRHSKVRYYDENFVPLWGEPSFMRAIHQSDPKMVEELVEKTSVLIEDEKLRRSMGKAGKQEVEMGKFSIETRNKKLRKIFDAALESGEKI